MDETSEKKAEGHAFLLIDRAPEHQRFLVTVAAQDGWRAAIAGGSEEVQSILATHNARNFRAILVDEATLGEELRSFTIRVQQSHPNLPVIILAAPHKTVDVLRVFQVGASDFLYKPTNAVQLLATLSRLLDSPIASGSELYPLSEKLPIALEPPPDIAKEGAGESASESQSNASHSTTKHSAQCLGLDDMVGAEIRPAIVSAKQAATRNVPVLISGEAGTGKETLARAMHKASARCKQSLIVLDCNTIAPSLLTSELFGHKSHAFTGAFENRRSRLFEADKGTVIIAHAELLPLDAQARLLAFLRNGNIQPLGSEAILGPDVRLLITASDSLATRVEAGLFDKELYQHLTKVQIALPALSERRGDIAALAASMLHRFAVLIDAPPKQLTDSALRLLSNYGWAGNVRELHDVLLRVALRGHGSKLDERDFPTIAAILNKREELHHSHAPKAKGTEPVDTTEIALHGADGHIRSLEEIEADVIRCAISYYQGHMSMVARRLGIGRSTLYRKINELKMKDVA